MPYCVLHWCDTLTFNRIPASSYTTGSYNLIWNPCDLNKVSRFTVLGYQPEKSGKTRQRFNSDAPVYFRAKVKVALDEQINRLVQFSLSLAIGLYIPPPTYIRTYVCACICKPLSQVRW